MTNCEKKVVVISAGRFRERDRRGQLVCECGARALLKESIGECLRRAMFCVKIGSVKQIASPVLGQRHQKM